MEKHPVAHFVQTHFYGPRMMVAGFFFVILIGSLLLTLPISSSAGNSTSFIDALFTSTSAVCVTGLAVFPTFTHWSLFGKIVIICLIQIGGLGFMTMVTMLFLFMGKRITLKERIMIQQSLNQNDIQGMVKLVRSILIGTLIFEGIAALIFMLRLLFDGYGFIAALGTGLFHSVSSFCNAGFDIFGPDSMAPYVTDPVMNIFTMFLIIVGGLGYSVWTDVLKVVKAAIAETKKTRTISLGHTYAHFNLQSKIVLETTGLLILAGFVIIFISEFTNKGTIGDLSLGGKLIASLFQSVTTRTCGFFTIPQEKMHVSSQLMSVVLMFIGGSPAGTAGGIKTVSFAVIILAVFSVIRGGKNIVVHNKSVSMTNLQKALAIVIMQFMIIIIATMLLSFSERYTAGYNLNFMDLLFEVVSATGTVGLTLGITPHLTALGKLIISVCMFIGRVGPITVAVSLSIKQLRAEANINYPEEKIIVG